jgi:uncharacterized membrane protein YkvA (DUF1232 family)
MKLPRLLKFATTKRLSIYLFALWKLFKHPDTPPAAKWVAIAVVAYAVSPIDLIPDFIPVLGLLDELILVPLGVALVIRLTPKPLWESLLREAEAHPQRVPRLWWGAAAIVVVWLLMLAGAAWWLWGGWRP